MSVTLNNSKLSTIKGSDFQKCGEILMAPKTNLFMMACLFCEGKTFGRMQSFKRHLYQFHDDKIKFQSGEIVYSVEELINRTYCGDDESEESGVAEDCLRWSEDDGDMMETSLLYHKGRLNTKGGVDKKGTGDDVKGATLGNMSILEALEDCDVSLTFMENLDTTIMSEEKDKSDGNSLKDRKENQKVFKNAHVNITDNERDEGMDMGHDEDDDCNMDSTLLKRIQLDLELGNDEAEDKDTTKTEKDKLSVGQDHKNSQEDEDANVTLTEDNLNTSLNTTAKSNKAGLKNLLCGLEDLDDVDDLLDNIEDSFISMPKENNEIEKNTPTKNSQELEKIEDDYDIKLIKEIRDKSDVAVDEQDAQKSVEHEEVSRKKMTALELQIMADLDMDEYDLEVCLNKDLSEAQITMPAVKESTSVKTPKSNRKSLKSKLNSQTPKQEKDIGNEFETKPANDTMQLMNSTKGTPKSRKSLKNNTKKTPTTRSPNAMKDSDFAGKKTTTEDSKELTDTPKSIKDTPKSRKATATTPSAKNSNESQRKSLAIIETIEKELVDTKKFEEGIGEENSSTLMCSNTNRSPIECQKNKDNCLKSLLEKELDGDEDLDLLINQLETSSSSRNSETELNKTIIAEEASDPINNSNDKEDMTTSTSNVDGSSCSRESESELNKTIITDDISETINKSNEKEATIKPAEVAIDDGPRADFDDEEADMAIFNKFIGLSSEDAKECSSEEIEGSAEEDLDDFENLLNEDLSKALEHALGEEDVGMESLEKEISQKMEERKEIDLNNDNKELTNLDNDLLKTDKEKAVPEDHEKENCVQEPHQAMNISQSLSATIKSIKSPQNKNTCAKRTKPAVSEEEYQGKFKKTNIKSRNIQGKPIILQENNVHSNNIKTMVLKESNRHPLVNKNSSNCLVKQQSIISHQFKDNQDVLLQRMLNEKPNALIKNLPPVKSKGNQENSPVKQRKTQITPSSRCIQQTKSEVSLFKIKREKMTPARSFINTNRGEMTPLKVEDLFLKQSNKSRQNTDEKQRTLCTPKTPEENIYKKSPSQCKMNLNEMNLLKTPTTTKPSPPKNLCQKTPTQPTIPSQMDRLKSPTPTKDEKEYFTTPQKTRNLSVKVLRITPSTNNKRNMQSISEMQISPTSFKSHAQPSATTLTKTSPLSALESQYVSNKFKLPKGITISKVPPPVLNTYPTMVEVTPSRSNYCKQNFTEHSLQQQLLEEKQHQSTETLLKSVPSSITITKRRPPSVSSRLRARQASIDIVSGKSLPPCSKTPKPGNLNYKSYAVHRSARKKEVLQKMRHIKKQIFKSIGTDTLLQAVKIKSPLMIKKGRRTKIQIENVAILPKLKQEVLTPLLNTQKLSPQLPSPQFPMGKSPKETPPKRLNENAESISPERFLNTPSVLSQKEGPWALKTPTTSTVPTQNDCSAGLKTPTTSSPPKQKERAAGLKTPTTSSAPKQKDRAADLKTPTASSPPKEEGRSEKQKPLTSPSIQKKCSLTPKTPTTSSPNKVERAAILKTPTTSSRRATLKRAATSPLQDEVQPVKRAYKSPSQDKKGVATKTTELEATPLGLSDSVVDFLQRDLKANRINVDSLLSDEMPVDDTMPDETINTEEHVENDDDVEKLEKNDTNTKDVRTDGSIEEVENNGSTKKDENNKGCSEKKHIEKVHNMDTLEKVEEPVENNVIAKEANKKDDDNRDSSVKKSVETVKNKTTDEPDIKRNPNHNTEPESSILNDLLEQVDHEQNSADPNVSRKIPLKKETKAPTKHIEDYDETKDLALLEKVGLQIVKIFDIDEFQTIEEFEDTERLAQTFANICKTFPTIFSSKQAETEVTFDLLLRNINKVLKTDLTQSDMKRLVNMIVMWYANCYNNKLIEKKSLSYITNKFLLMFHFIPKTIKRIYYCEFCEEHFNTEHRYYTHRITHTGALYPYQCKNCPEGFTRINKHKVHEMLCKKELRVLVKNEKVLQTTSYGIAIGNSETSNANVKTVYNCAKCELAFTSESDVNNHVASCNRSIRRQPKTSTPRPKAKIEPCTKN